jgi:hypothetical protein
MPTPSVQQNLGPSHGGLGEGEIGIATARRGEHRDIGWESGGERDDEPEGPRTAIEAWAGEKAWANGLL